MKKLIALMPLCLLLLIAACGGSAEEKKSYPGIWKQNKGESVSYVEITEAKKDSFNVLWYLVAIDSVKTLKIDGDTVSSLQTYTPAGKTYVYTPNKTGGLTKVGGKSTFDIKGGNLVWTGSNADAGLTMAKTRHTNIKEAIKEDFPNAK